MKRCYAVSREILKFLVAQEPVNIKRAYSLWWERIHSLGTARAAAILSAKRGGNIELAHAAGALHDIGRILIGTEEGHALKGYETSKEFLAKMLIFDGREIEEIAVAVKNHNRKDLVGAPLDEITKDADILDTFFLGIDLRTEVRWQRLAALQKEIGF